MPPWNLFLLFLYVYISFYIYEARCPPIGLTHDREHEKIQDFMGTWKLKRVDVSWDNHSDWKF